MSTVSMIEDNGDDRERSSGAIRSDTQLCLVGAHATAQEALKHFPHDKPDVALVDIQLPDMDGIECIRRLRAIVPALPTRFIILTGHEDDNLIFRALRAGAHGYLLKGLHIGQAVSCGHQRRDGRWWSHEPQHRSKSHS